MAGWIINRPKATITCSKCKARLNAKLFMDLLEAWNFCPYCGADMRAEQTESTGYKMKPVEQTEPQTDEWYTLHTEPQREYEKIVWLKDRGWIEDEPQTEVETMSCAECKHRPIGAEICEEACHYEPKTDWHYDEQDATWYPYKHEDEPQTEVKVEPTWVGVTYGRFEDKPHTERSE